MSKKEGEEEEELEILVMYSLATNNTTNECYY